MTRSPHVQYARNVLCGLAVAAALGSFQVAHAGYAQATPPAGWSAGGGAGGSFTGTKAANGATFLSGSVSTNASLNVGGRAVSMPATMRFAANAPRVAAAAIMLNPYLRGAATIAGWLGLASLAYDPLSGLWTKPDEQAGDLSDGYYWDSVYLSPASACARHFPYVAPNATYAFHSVSVSSTRATCNGVAKKADGGDHIIGVAYVNKGAKSNCPVGWYVTSAGCVQTPPPKTVTQDEAVEELTKHPMPADVPKHIPVPLPVDMPYFEPMFIPTGNPVANPKYDPSKPLSPENQPYVQPGTKVTPAPAPGAPWQVDTTPVNRPTPTPEGSTEPSTEPSPDTPREEGKEDRDFCDKNPNALACLELDTPEGEIPKGTFNVTYAVENSWGSGSCPADKYATIAGRSIKVYDWEQTCDYVATYVRPILLVLCALGALFIVMPGRAET